MNKDELAQVWMCANCSAVDLKEELVIDIRVPLLGSNGFIYCNEIVSVCRDCGSWDIFPAFGGDNIELLPENH